MAAPTLLSISDTNGTLDLSGNIVLTFDVPIAAGSGEVRLDVFGRPWLIEDIHASEHVTISGNTLTIDPPQDLAYGSIYQLYLFNGVVNNAQTGEPLTPMEHFFTTGASPHPLQLSGTSGDDVLQGSSFDDDLSGGDGNDDLRGGDGNDHLAGGAGNDYLDGAGGNNTLLGGDGDDNLSVWGFDTAAANLLDGGAGNDRLTSNSGVCTMLGGAGDDILSIEGGSGTLDGGDGSDHIYIGKADAAISIRGGAGIDHYVLAPDLQTPVTITDFMAGKGGDILDPYSVLYMPQAQAQAAPNPPLPPQDFLYITGHLWLQQDGADTLLQIDRDGAAGHAFHLQTIAILRNTSAADLTPDNFAFGRFRSEAQQGMTLNGGAGGEHLAGGNLNDALYGNDGNDQIAGLAGNDFLNGGNGDDSLAGMDGNDALYGGEGNDTLEGGAGNDTLDGDNGALAPDGGRVDRAIYDTAFANVQLKHTSNAYPDSWQVQDTTGLLGTDTLTHIERLRFTDKQWALDVGLQGNAGQVYRLYQAAFDRQPDIAGLSYWIHAVDEGLGIDTVADSFARSDEFHQLFGAAPTNADLVSHLYHNVLHREPDMQGYAYWVDRLDKKMISTGQVLYLISDSAENYQNVAKIIGNGFEYIG